jgi:hypothetical protein
LLSSGTQRVCGFIDSELKLAPAPFLYHHFPFAIADLTSSLNTCLGLLIELFE